MGISGVVNLQTTSVFIHYRSTKSNKLRPFTTLRALRWTLIRKRKPNDELSGILMLDHIPIICFPLLYSIGEFLIGKKQPVFLGYSLKLY